MSGAAPFLAFLLGGAFAWGMTSSGLIAGPLREFGLIMREAAAGRFPVCPASLDGGKRFGELSDDLNRLLDAMRSDRTRREDLSRELGVLEILMESGELNNEECRDVLRGMREHLGTKGRNREQDPAPPSPAGTM